MDIAHGLGLEPSAYPLDSSAPPSAAPPLGHPPEESSLCALKFLVTNSSAGSIIGKGGCTITQLQEQSTAKIKVANSNDFFPGSTERCVLITGTLDAILTAASLVVMKIQESEQHGSDGKMDMGAPFTAKMLVPNSAVGAIIGKGGATINEMSATCGAQMKVSSKDAQAMLGLTERMVSVTGDLSQMNIAVNLVVSKMRETPASAQYQNMTTSYGRRSVGLPTAAMGALSLGGPERQTNVTISVLDSLAGFIVGKEGTTLREIQRQSGAKIVMSRRGEYIPGTQSRSVSLEGSAASVQAAQMLITQKIQQAAIKDVTGMTASPS